jgi:hypothetical protein
LSSGEFFLPEDGGLASEAFQARAKQKAPKGGNKDKGVRRAGELASTTPSRWAKAKYENWPKTGESGFLATLRQGLPKANRSETADGVPAGDRTDPESKSGSEMHHNENPLG